LFIDAFLKRVIRFILLWYIYIPEYIRDLPTPAPPRRGFLFFHTGEIFIYAPLGRSFYLFLSWEETLLIPLLGGAGVGSLIILSHPYNSPDNQNFTILYLIRFCFDWLIRRIITYHTNAATGKTLYTLNKRCSFNTQKI